MWASATPLRRLQITLVTFFVVAVASLCAILVEAPEIYAQSLNAAPGTVTVPLFFTALLTFIAALVIGVLRRWRWVFWGVLVAFTAGIIGIPADALQIAGILQPRIPVWYGALRIGISIVQVAIAIWMWRLYWRYGVWAKRYPAGASP